MRISHTDNQPNEKLKNLNNRNIKLLPIFLYTMNVKAFQGAKSQRPVAWSVGAPSARFVGLEPELWLN